MNELKVFGEFVSFGAICSLVGWLFIKMVEHAWSTQEMGELIFVCIIFVVSMIAYNGIRNDIEGNPKNGKGQGTK